MKNWQRVASISAVVATMGFVAVAMGAAAASKGVSVGDPAPEWVDLEGVDGKLHALGDLKEAKAVVVVFTCNHCPVAKAYEERLNEMYGAFHDRDVEVVAISVSNGESDKLPAMKERAEEKGFKFAYIHDPSQDIGRAFGATVTPHAFVLDGKRRVVYVGAIDDNMNAKKVETHYVRDAVEAVLADKPVETAETEPSGCGIGYE
jgi:peroxiredoxin